MQPKSQGDNMKLKPIASNMTELELDGAEILFSYQTPVAAIIDGGIVNGIAYRRFVRTNKKWSQTTSRHINKFAEIKGFIASSDNALQPQEFFDNLISRAK